MKKISKYGWITLLLVLALGAFGLSQAMAVTPGLYEVVGAGTNCANLYQVSIIDGPDDSLADLGPLFGFKYDDNPKGSLTHTLTDDSPWVVTNGPQDPFNSVSILNVLLNGNGNGIQFDWAATLGIDAVIVKARDANAYVYFPEVFGDTGLVAPDNKEISHVEFCYDYELAATKTANTSYTRTYTWDITKEFDGEYWKFIGDPATAHGYTVSVDRIETDSDFAVSGNIIVSNPTPYTTSFSVADFVEGIEASVSCPSYTLAPNASVTCSYSASLLAKANGTNTATVTSATQYVGDATATADYTFGDPTTIVGFPTIHVTDSYAGALGSASGDFTFEYSRDFTCSADPDDYTDGSYSDTFINTATITETGASDDASVTVHCYAPVVSKDAETAYTRTYTWTIDKKDDATYKKFIGDPATVHPYTVTVDQTIGESAFAVSGDITVYNPNPMADMTVSLADSVGGTPATLDCGGTLVVPANGSATCGYSAPLAAKTDGTNTATATLNSITFPATADYTFGDPTTIVGFPTIHVTDTNGQAWNASGDVSWDYTKNFTCPTDKSLYAAGMYVVPDHINTATITETGQSDTATVKLTCYAPVVTKDAETEWFRKYDWDIFKTADPTNHTGFAGESFSSDYDVFVDQTITDYGYRAFGTISVSNPAGSPGQITVDVADAVNGTSATLDCAGSLTIPAGETRWCDYTVNLPDNTDRINTATVTFNTIPFTAAATVDFGDPIVEGFPTIGVTDSYAGALGSVSGDFTFEYSREFSCSSLPDDYTAGFDRDTYDNIATITQTGASDDASVTVDCYAPVITKTADGTYDKTHTWDIDKSVKPGKSTGYPGDLLSWTWEVTLSETYNEDNFAISGVISVYNPALEPMTVEISDVLDDSTPVVLACGGSLTIPAGETGTCAYSAVPTSKAATTNTATAILNGISFSYAKMVNWVANVINGSAVVTDAMIGLNETVYAGEGPWVWTETDTHTCSSLKSDYTNAYGYYYDETLYNTAYVHSGGIEQDKAKAEHYNRCDAGFMDLLKWTDGMVDPSKTWSFALFIGPDGFDSGAPPIATATTSGDMDGILFDDLALRPDTTYTVCELEVNGGWTSFWQVDYGTGFATVIPYNPNADDAPPADVGNRCVDFQPGVEVEENVGGKLINVWRGISVHFQVNNTYPGGDPRTPGYWKNWNRCTGGGQQYTADANGGWEEGFWLLEDVLDPSIGGGIIWDDILSDNKLVPINDCYLAVSILNTRDFSTGKVLASDPGYNLAKHLLAAQLNLGAGACKPAPETGVDIDAVILAAETLLDKVDFDVVGIGIDKKKQKDEAAEALWLATILDQYNNGMYCGSTYVP